MKQPTDQYLELLDAGDFEGLERYLEGMLARRDDWSDLEQLGACGVSRGAVLHRWAVERPSSYSLTVLGSYWYERAGAFRGEDVASKVTNEQWTAAHAAADQAARAYFAALTYDGAFAVIAAEGIIGVSGFLGLPIWAEDRQVSLVAPDPDTPLPPQLEKTFGWVEWLPLPAVPPWFDPVDMTPLLNFIQHRHPDYDGGVRSVLHFLRPRWGGSYEQMQALLDGPFATFLTAPQRARYQAWIDTDPFDCDLPRFATRAELDTHISPLVEILNTTTEPDGRAQILLVLGDIYSYSLDDEEDDAFRCYDEATEIYRKTDACENVIPYLLARQPESKKIFDLGHLYSVHGALTYALCYKFGIGEAQANADLADRWLARAYDLNPITDDWQAFADHIDDLCDSGWAIEGTERFVLYLLEEGARRAVPGCAADLVQRLSDYGKSVASARPLLEAAANGGDLSARRQVVLLEIEDTDDPLDWLNGVNALIEIGRSGDDDALRKAVENLAVIDVKPELAFQLCEEAEVSGHDWALSHLAYHHYFGVGTKRDKERGLDYAQAAVESDAKDELATKVLNYHRSPLRRLFGTPKKV